MARSLLALPNARGAAFMMISMFGFAANDAAIKALAPDFGLFPSIFWRGLVGCALLGLLAWRMGGFAWRPSRRDGRLALARAASETFATFTFLSALLLLPLTTATAILQVTPLTVTLAAALFLGEPTGWRRYLASFIGLCAVLLIIRPDAGGLNMAALFAILAVFAVTARDLITRQLTAEAPTLPIALVTSLLVTSGGGIAMLATTGLRVPSVPVMAALSASAVFLMVGYVFAIRAMRSGEIGFVSPFRYSILIWALLLGIFVFHEVPDPLTCIGAAILVATGLYTFARERAQRGAG